jgi:capsular exopolysaccharide synthesis family protein
MPGDGKTISAINLAAALSLQENLRVLLLDGDFRRSSATRLLGLPTTPGLGEVLRHEAALESSLVRTAQFPNLYVLPPGTPSPGPAELLSTVRWQSLLEIVRSEFRFVVLDAPPVGAVAEYELLQLACDGVVLVLRQDFTNRRLWQRALETVPKAKQLGVILNCAEQWFLWKTHSYYYYSGAKQ